MAIESSGLLVHEYSRNSVFAEEAMMTQESLRDELQLFVEHTLRPCLHEMIPLISKAVREEIMNHQESKSAVAQRSEAESAKLSDSLSPAVKTRSVPARSSLLRASSAMDDVSCPLEAPFMCSPSVRQEVMNELQQLQVPMVSTVSAVSAPEEDGIQRACSAVSVGNHVSKTITYRLKSVEEAGGESTIVHGQLGIGHALAKRAASREEMRPSCSVGPPAVGCRQKVLDLVEWPTFEHAVLAVISANAIFIAAEIDYYARRPEEEDDTSGGWLAADMMFLFVFVVELALRLIAYKWAFFHRRFPTGERNPLWFWNVLDFTILFFQMLSYVRSHLVALGAVGNIAPLARMLRLCRLVRVFKVFRWFHHPRVIMLSVYRSFPLFVWSWVALQLMTLMFACWFTEVVRYHRKANEADNEDELDKFFGTIPRTMLSLGQAVSGGMDWRDLSDELSGDPSMIILGAMPLNGYVWFTLLAVMNVITGVFLETAIGKAKEEKEILLATHAARIFKKADTDNSGRICWGDFSNAVTQNRSVQDFFDAIDIDHSQARTLFHLLDNSGDGFISAQEFLQGCMNLSGPAKSLDLVILSKKVKQLFERHLRIELAGVLEPQEEVADPRAEEATTDQGHVECNTFSHRRASGLPNQESAAEFIETLLSTDDHPLLDKRRLSREMQRPLDGPSEQPSLVHLPGQLEQDENTGARPPGE